MVKTYCFTLASTWTGRGGPGGRFGVGSLGGPMWLAAVGVCLAATWAVGQTQPGTGASTTQPIASRSPIFNIDGPSQRLEIIVTNSRLLTMKKKIPRLLVNNPEVVRATPLSPNQIQLVGAQVGVTTVNVWDEDGKIYSIDVIVKPDARQLEEILKTEFPDASVRVRPLANSVYLTGYVPRGDMVDSIVRIAEEYYPSVINNLSVGGVQQIALKVKVMEVSRTKLRRAGFDWSYIDGNTAIVQSVSGLLGGVAAGVAANAVTGDPATPPTATATGSDTVRFQIVDGNRGFFGFIDALRQYDLIKVLAEPTLVTVSGRPASFNSGGEFPVIVPQSLGTVSIEYREFGTRVDFVPLVLGNGSLRLEVRPSVSEIDPARSVVINNITVPGLRTRWVDTAVEMQAGQTLALAGLIQNRVEARNRGLPWLADLPWVGAAFRHVQEEVNEIELLIMVTPEFVDGVDAHEMHNVGPGMATANPNDVELYWRGYLEVPNCEQGGVCPDFLNGYGEEAIPEGKPTPAPASAEQASRKTGGGLQADIRQPSSYLPSRSIPVKPVRATVRSDQPGLIGPAGYDELRR